MTTPRWTKNAYVKLILAILLILGLIITFVCLSNYDVFSSSQQLTQEKKRLESSKSNSLKSLVASWLKGESDGLFIYWKICEVDVISALMIII